jgi:hypothetical protein
MKPEKPRIFLSENNCPNAWSLVRRRAGGGAEGPAHYSKGLDTVGGGRLAIIFSMACNFILADGDRPSSTASPCGGVGRDEPAMPLIQAQGTGWAQGWSMALSLQWGIASENDSITFFYGRAAPAPIGAGSVR